MLLVNKILNSILVVKSLVIIANPININRFMIRG